MTVVTDHEEWIGGIVETLGGVMYSENSAEQDRDQAVELLDWLEPKIRAAERERILEWMEGQIENGLDSSNPESAIRVLMDRIETGEYAS